MTCKEIRLQLPDLARNLPPAAESAVVTEHLASCEGCREESEQLRSLFLELEKDRSQIPDPGYWISLVPRIHRRIGEKPVRVLPQWITGLALPAAAAVVVVIITSNLLPRNGVGETQEIAVVLHQLPAGEVQQAAEQQMYGGILEPSPIAGEHAFTSADDKEMLGELLKEEGTIREVPGIDPESTLDNLNSQDVDKFVSILEQKFPEN